MFQVKTGSKMCMNASCGSTSTVEWKKGWPLRSGALADLCYRCGLAYESSVFCETFHLDQSGWRECCLCNKRLHCGCIASKLVVEFMDYGGVGCTTCTNRHQPNLNKRSESPGLFSRLLMNKQDTNGETGIRSKAGLFPQPLVPGDDKREESIPHHGFSNLMKPDNKLDAGEMHESSQPSLNMALATLPYSFSFANATKKLMDGASSQPHTVQSSASSILQRPSKSVLGTPPGTSKSAQTRIGRPPLVKGRGRSHLLPRYWPKYTEKELQQLSGKLNLKIKPLFEKTLSASDASRVGRLVIPKSCAEAFFPPINQSEGIPLKIQDVRGKEWTFQFRFWPNNNSRMYVLEGVNPCIQSMRLQADDTVTFSRVNPSGKLIMGFRKVAHTGDIQGSDLTNGTSNGDTSSSGVTETPTSINASSGPSQAPEELNGGRSCDDPSRVKDKKRTRTVKSKRLICHSEESMEVRLTWEETQELIRPSPSAKPTIMVIEEHEFEEFDEPPVFGKRTIITSRPSEYKKRRTEEEPSGLDALASAAALGDTLDEAEGEAATTTRHPRHKVGCSCIVCIQPPSGKGRHKSSCVCTVCSTVKRRFTTLAMRRKKKQLEREETEAAAAADQENKKIDLNSDPCSNRENVEAVGVLGEEESERREGVECLGVAQAGEVLGEQADRSEQ